MSLLDLPTDAFNLKDYGELTDLAAECIFRSLLSACTRTLRNVIRRSGYDMIREKSTGLYCFLLLQENFILFYFILFFSG